MGFTVRATLVLAGLGLAAPLPAQMASPMSRERIRDAIAWGETAPEKDLELYTLHADPTWVLVFDTPFLRVAQLARAMKIQNQPITEDDIAPRHVAPELNLYAHARDASGARDLPNVEYVAIVKMGPDGPSESVLALSVQSFLRRVPRDDGADGPSRIARSVKAAFPLSALVAGNEVRILFQGGALQRVRLSPELLSRVR